MSYLVYNVDVIGEVLHESSVEVHTVPFLLDIQVVIGKVEVFDPMIFACALVEQLKDSSAVITLGNEGTEL